MYQKIQQTLLKIGLTKHEAAAYVALLEMGKGSADSVAARAEMKRSTAYLALESLLRQGLVLKIPRARKMLFIAKDPEEIRLLEEEKLQEVDRMVPLLRAISSEADYFGTRLYEGIDGMKSAYQFRRDELSDTEYVAFFGYVENLDSDLKKYIMKWNEENAERKIRSRAIVPDHPSLKDFRETDAAFLREVKVIPASKYPSNISIDIYDDFTRLVLFEDKAAVIIESKALTRALRSIFEMLW